MKRQMNMQPSMWISHQCQVIINLGSMLNSCISC